MEIIYDDIIIGAGSAGCVLANRLSENPNRKILLIEAGPDYPDIDTIPADILSSSKPTYTHDWDYVSEPGLIKRSIKLRRAKITGGCSATNATIALRGAKENYDEWDSLGNNGWSFESVLPFFRKLENDLDFDYKWHGNKGPISITRYTPDEFHSAFLKVCEKSGFPYTEDLNAPGTSGAGLIPANAINGIRQSTAITYLADARRRNNLVIRSNCVTDKIAFVGRKAASVILATGEVIKGNRIILSCGSYGSPPILMRSGIGPSNQLNSFRIETVIDLKGVGENLIDHPLLGLLYSVEQKEEYSKKFMLSALLYKSSPDLKSYDLMIIPTSIMEAKPELSSTGAFFILFASVLQPKSRGKLKLRTKEPNDPPRIDLGYFNNPDDMKLMVQAVNTARKMTQMKPLSDHIVSEIFPGKDVKSIEDAIIQRAETYHHPVGTCKMGNDNMSVVDSKCKVHGIENLYVIDASVMPNITSANTNIPVIMIAERCCEWLI